MAQYEFGSGTVWGVPTISLAGDVISVPTPVPFGALQDITIDMTFSFKELYGLYQFPLAVGRGTAKLTGKAKAARFSAHLFNLVFGETLNAGEIKGVYQEVGAIANNQVTVAHNDTFVTDLGVVDAVTGIPMVRAASSPILLEYIVANGVYTFNSSFNNSVKISYTYTLATGIGLNFIINNQLLGLTPYFQLVLNQVYQGKVAHITFNRAISNKLSLATKLEDFTIPEFDIAMMADDSGQIGSISVAEF
jgi:hypothetical protein